MIDRQHGKIIFECDSCPEIEEFDASDHRDRDNFDAAWAQLKEAGWKAKKVGKAWVHGCPRCGV